MDVMPVVAGSVTIEVAFSGHIVGVRRGAGFDRGGEALLLQHSQHLFKWQLPKAAEAQATDRAYRIGQHNPVFVHKLLCQDTVEERIHKLQQEKGKLAAGILADADNSNRIDAATVRALLGE